MCYDTVMKNNLIAKILLVVLVLLFLYAPIAVIIAQSFNASRYRGNWTGFTLDWYASLFTDEEILEAFFNTLVIGFLSAGIATAIGLVTCLAVAGFTRTGRIASTGVANISMLNADIVTGISLMLLFMGMGMKFGFGTVLLSHIIFNVPYAMLNILPGVMAMDKSTYESAMDLGAHPVRAFFDVVLPGLVPGIVSGFLMSFTMSADDFIITHFTRGAGVDTLPTKIYSELKIGIHPEMYALMTLMTIALVLLFMLVKLNRRAAMKNTYTTLRHRDVNKQEHLGVIG